MACSAPSFVWIVLVAFLPLVIIAAPEVQLSLGRIQGSDLLAKDTQKPYYGYYGIPFAEPPVGQLRFRPPVPFAGRDPNAVISSSTYRAACFQSAEYTQSPVSEDCLYLNIFAPIGTSRIRKVMVWIHGGGYLMGETSTFTPSGMVTDNDVIVVAIQYRLGAFGFLSSDKTNGNNGLRDQIQAIKWVKDNIPQFGGDPYDITIFGESAGSGSVSFLSISPLTKGLFTKAIMQSETVLSYWSNIKNHEDQLYEVARQLGCSRSWYYIGWLNKENYRADLMNCLRTKTAAEIQNLSPAFDLPDENSLTNGVVDDGDDLQNDNDEMTNAGLILDDVTYSPYPDGEVIPRDPRSLMADKDYLQNVGALDRDYIVGCTNNEASIEKVTTPMAAARFFKDAASFIFPLSTSVNQEVMDLHDYQYGYPRDSSGHAPLQGLFDVATDAQFVLPVVLFARALTKASDQTNVYLYLFDHYPEQSQPNSPLKGSTHGLDVLYEFDVTPSILDFITFYANIPSAADGNLSAIFRGFLTTFAKTGKPSSSTQGIPSYWPRFDPQQEYYMAISPSPEVRQHMFAKRVSLWTDFLFKKGGVFGG